ncbi:MAG: KOW domain-containing RNA-binding protein [Ruminococcus sp.]|jgi:ribosomal protein L14E/L6E/L27E|nr:KOW domain-containing RNA-binding protein [Ruminococcus sp.]
MANVENKLVPGCIAVSKKGRDSGKFMCVIRIENNFVYVADGKTHKLKNLKKKSIKHLKMTDTLLNETTLNNLTDKNLRRIFAAKKVNKEADLWQRKM